MNTLMPTDRRTLMRNVALLLGAAALPGLAACSAAMEGPGALDEDRLRLLTAVADTIIPVTDTPGAVAAGVPRLLSGLMRDWASQATWQEIVQAIDAIGELGSGQDFAALDLAQRTEILVAYDQAAVQPGPPRQEPLEGLAVMLAGPPTANPSYVRLKQLIINLYYTSEIAMTEELLYEHVPGRFVSSLEVTPETRPFAGVSDLG